MPVTPAVVRWARKEAGMSLNEAKRQFPRISEWEVGTAEPTYSQVEGMAKKFKVPVAVFFFPDPPRIEPLSKSFRTLPQGSFEELPTRIRMLIRKAKGFQLDLHELLSGHQNDSRSILKSLSVTSSIAGLASAVRRHLGISLDQQRSWPDASVAVKNWRHALFEVGVYVFKDAFLDNRYCGFCLYDNEFPLIYVNNSTAYTRQAFTIFHELYHLFLNTSGIDTDSDEMIDYGLKSEIEIKCNRFSSEFLLPTSEFQERTKNKRPSRLLAHTLSGEYNVSRELVYRKFMNLGLVEKSEYEHARMLWNSQANRQGSEGGNYYRNQMTYLGSDYVKLAFERYYQNRIDQVKLADYLNVRTRNLSGLEDVLLRQT